MSTDLKRTAKTALRIYWDCATSGTQIAQSQESEGLNFYGNARGAAHVALSAWLYERLATIPVPEGTFPSYLRLPAVEIAADILCETADCGLEDPEYLLQVVLRGENRQSNFMADQMQYEIDQYGSPSSFYDSWFQYGAPDLWSLLCDPPTDD